MNAILEVKNIQKSFKISRKQKKSGKIKEKYKTAVNNLSFTAYKGEILGLLGPNGAGKTTAMRIISTLIKPDSGTVLINGMDITQNPMEVRKKIGFLTSDLKLEEFFSPNYLFDFFASLYHMSNEVKAERKKLLFDKFGINEFADTKIGDLSTGMKQKVSIAISIVHDPDIIIFDEPTNGLDVITAKTVTDFLVEMKELGKCIVISTHILSLVEKYCDRIGIIIGGKMMLYGEIGAVTPNNNLETIFFDLYNQSNAEAV